MNTFFYFFAARSAVPVLRLIGLAATAGLASTLLLFILNAGAANVVQGDSSTWPFAIFVAVLLVSISAQRVLFTTVTTEVEKVLDCYRMAQVECIRRCDLDALERVGPTRIFDALTRQTRPISTGASTIIMGAQSVILLTCALIYLAWLDSSAFLLAAAIIVLGALVYLSRMRAARARLEEANAGENDLFATIKDLIDGFSEVRLNRHRSADLAKFVAAISGCVGELTTEADNKLTELFIFSQFVIFGAAGAMVFLLPGMGVVVPQDLLMTITVMLFLMSPITAMAAAAQSIAMAGASCDVLSDLERQLLSIGHGPRTPAEPLVGFDVIELRRVAYRHRLEDGAKGFQVGPVDLVLRQGEVLFIAGGNGSGKSTLLRLLTALYVPKHGEIVVDGRTVDAGQREAYQALFSTVFWDFHLFQRTFGLHTVSPDEVRRWLEVMEIANKTSYHGGRFDTLKLSTGQRKRLAFVVAALEDRPVIVLDEFAADQDPAFRRKFYDEILPLLTARGKTVVAVTHDQRYFSRATRHLTMHEGQFVEQRKDDD